MIETNSNPDKICAAIDSLAYSFLSKQGYRTQGATTSERARHRIIVQMRKRRQTLRHEIVVASDKMQVRFALHCKDGTVIHSKVLTIKLQGEPDDDAE